MAPTPDDDDDDDSTISSTSSAGDTEENLPPEVDATINILLRKPSYLRDCITLTQNVANKLEVPLITLYELLEVRLGRHPAPKLKDAGSTCPKTQLREKYYFKRENLQSTTVLRNRHHVEADPLPTDFDRQPK